MKLRFFAGLLALNLALSLTLGVPALAAGVEDRFPAVAEYPGYGDVAQGDWFYENAKLCYEIGLMTGKESGFDPTGEITGPECAAIAARMLEKLTGKAIVMPTPKPGEDLLWYQGYVDYLEEAVQASGSSLYGAIKWHDLALFEQPVSRWDLIVFLALVAEGNRDYFPPINQVESLPDVSATDNVTRFFYEAGILTGTDKYGTFAGERTITRAEVAAMVSRMARPELRLAFSPAEAPGSQADPATAQTPFEQTLLDITDYSYTESDLQALCAYAGLEADDVMVQMEGFPDITAKFYVGLLLDFCFRMDSKALEEGYEGPWNLSWTMDGVSLDGSAHCKRLVLNMCVKTAMFMENSNASFDAQSLRAFRDSHTVTETQLVQALDVEAFYKACLGS